MTAAFATDYQPGAFLAAMDERQRAIATAATLAMRDLAKLVQKDGRADIGAAGFPKRWQDGLKVKVFPETGISLDPVVAVTHRIPFAGVFEEGATIFGKPLLWLPLPTVPRGPQGHALTPRQYAARVGPLVSLRRGRGARPLLAAKPKQRGGKAVPLYVGLDRVTIPKKFDITGVVQRAADRFPDFYDRHFVD